jgi:hypothetical protein
MTRDTAPDPQNPVLSHPACAPSPQPPALKKQRYPPRDKSHIPGVRFR